MNEKFLDAFRALDTELKAEGSTVIDYENSLGTVDQEKMKVCRIMRNYMAHNDTTFIVATNEQVKFLDAQLLELRKKAHTVKDEMKRVKLVKPTEPIKNIALALDKYPVLPIETKTGIYLVDKDILIHNVAVGAKKIEIPTKLPKYKTTSKLERIENLTYGTYIVIDKDTYVGLLIV